MSLRGMARLILAGALVAVAVMALMVGIGWHWTKSDIDAVAELQQLRDRATELSITMDYATMLRPDAQVFADLALDAEALALDLERFPERSARLAAQQLLEVAHQARAAGETLTLLRGTPIADDRLRLIGQQMRIYHYDFVEGLRALLAERHRRVFERMAWLIAAFVVATLVLLLATTLQATTLHRRLFGPLAAIDGALRAVAAGATTTRIPALRQDELGRLAASFNAMMDARAAADAALRLSEERFRSVVEVSTDAVSDWNVATGEVWWSEGLRRSFGHDPSPMPLGENFWHRHLHPDDRDRITALFEAVRGGDAGSWHATYRFQRADGTYAEVRDVGVILRDGDGRVRRMIGAITDVTEQLDLEGRLRQLQKLEAVGQLTGGVAHDFNNLLTVVLGNSELLRAELEDRPELAEMASMIHEAADRGAALTQRLLAFSRRQALAPKPHDINAIVRGMEGLLRRTIGQAIEIRFALAADAWPAEIDGPQLESAILNLCLNARDAITGSGTLTIETRNAVVEAGSMAADLDLAPGDYVVVAISDSGKGMDSTTLERAFEPFFTTKPVGQGTGLGLSMVFGFVAQSKGQVRLYSEPGVGTTVKLYLPRAAIARAPTDRSESAPLRHAARSGTILLAEDDHLVRQHAVRLLRSLGYGVIEAESGDAALAILEGDIPIDGVLTDVIMPGRSNGKAVAERARALRPGLPVVLSSAFPGTIVFDTTDETFPLLRKPFTRDELVNKLDEAFAAAVP
ncbi:MAG: hybrid sensor histidine kinase/response regulator [Geminicoccaceae bacterium]|nr:MAG: hybrid sensor histidine kinase/response regulator [Geminicoccaceae bacterium]